MARTARRRTEVVEFRVEDTAAAVRGMDVMAGAHDGWINLHPVLRPEDEPPPRSGITTLLGGPVHDVPVCTWVAGSVTRRGPQDARVGIQHARGERVRARLAAAGVTLPEGWRLVQDHPRRGLVVTTAATTPHAEVVAWLLEAGAVLSAVRLSGDWRAELHLPRGSDPL